MKSTILLTTALFLASAPSPDAKTLTELSAGFLSVDNDYALMASETTLNTRFKTGISSQADSGASTDAYVNFEEQIKQAEQGNAATQLQTRIN